MTIGMELPSVESQARRIMPRSARALWYASMHEARLLPCALNNAGDEQVLVQTLYSAISRGTERLVFEGAVPQSEFSRMRAPLQEGAFPHPVKYGYCAVGRVHAGPSSLGGQDRLRAAPAPGLVCGACRHGACGAR